MGPCVRYRTNNTKTAPKKQTDTWHGSVFLQEIIVPRVACTARRPGCFFGAFFLTQNGLVDRLLGTIRVLTTKSLLAQAAPATVCAGLFLPVFDMLQASERTSKTEK